MQYILVVYRTFLLFQIAQDKIYVIILHFKHQAIANENILYLL